jgi:hypothetical protein
MTMTTGIIAERTDWAARISAAWQHSVDSIIETGRLLLAAKADPAMQHGEWGTMVESDLPFNRHTAHKLMQIASDKRLTNVSHGKHLPPSWTTLYELTKLDDETFDQKLPYPPHLCRQLRAASAVTDVDPRAPSLRAFCHGRPS